MAEVELKGGVLVNHTPSEQRIAGLGDLNKLPIGPTFSMIRRDPKIESESPVNSKAVQSESQPSEN